MKSVESFKRKIFTTTLIIILFSLFAIFLIIKGLEITEDYDVVNVSTRIDNSVYSEITKSSKSGTNDLIPVYLVGEVNKPGIYNVMIGTYLYEIISLAGGMTKQADRNSINLAFKINTNMMIKIGKYSDKSGEIETYSGYSTDLFPSKLENLTGEDSNVNDKIDINSADLKSLMTIPGVGESLAQAIIGFRKQNGNFVKIEDLMKVNGIKQGKFNQMRDYICVR